MKKELREKVAEEAAKLLYHNIVEEYLDAKKLAAEQLGTKILPKNMDVALKILKIALETEGEEYWKRLVSLRRIACNVMEKLSEFNPRLIGSVWRGIIKARSDVDIEIDCEDLDRVLSRVVESGLKIESVERIDLPEPLREGSLARIKIRVEDVDVEIILKEHQAYLNPARCDIYEDRKKGLTLTELKKILVEDPVKLFIPR